MEHMARPDEPRRLWMASGQCYLGTDSGVHRKRLSAYKSKVSSLTRKKNKRCKPVSNSRLASVQAIRPRRPGSTAGPFGTSEVPDLNRSRVRGRTRGTRQGRIAKLNAVANFGTVFTGSNAVIGSCGSCTESCFFLRPSQTSLSSL